MIDPFKTCWYCEACGKDKPICSPTSGRNCFKLHQKYGMPKKRLFEEKVKLRNKNCPVLIINNNGELPNNKWSYY